VRTFHKNRLTPVVCVLASESRLSEVAIEGLDHAVKAMLANAFLNLNKFPDDKEGNARLRRIFDYLILIDGTCMAASPRCTRTTDSAPLAGERLTEEREGGPAQGLERFFVV
jgi:hypothetical protein